MGPRCFYDDRLGIWFGRGLNLDGRVGVIEGNVWLRMFAQESAEEWSKSQWRDSFTSPITCKHCTEVPFGAYSN